MTLEREVQNQIMLEFGSGHDLRLWRVNAGKFFHVPWDAACSTCRHRGRWIEGAPAGATDLMGLLSTGQHLGIEVKRPTGGRVSPEQVRWRTMIEKHNGLHIIARSVEDVRAALP